MSIKPDDQNVVDTDPFMLVGHMLNDKWTVTEGLSSKPYGTGGCFSVPYLVQADDVLAFMKVIDIRLALGTPDPASEIQKLINSYQFERHMLERCESLSRVVTILDHGSIGNDSYPLFFLIFEYAEHTARGHLLDHDPFPNRLARGLRLLHHASVGLKQLHSRQVSHQDLKPSNLLLFERAGAKLGDLGRCVARDQPAPHSGLAFCGDKTYAPPEFLYGYKPADWACLRLSADLYQLGSLLSFICLDKPTTVCLRDYIPNEMWWATRTTTESYLTVVPHLQNAIIEISVQIQNVLREADVLRENETDQVAAIFRQLSHPLPDQRGHQRSHQEGVPFSLERYVSFFSRVAKAAEYRCKA